MSWTASVPIDSAEMTEQQGFAARAATIATILLACGGVVALLALSYIVYEYGWSGNRQFTSSMGAPAYYGLPALAAGLLFAALKLKSAHKIRLVLVGIALSTSVYGVELFLEITYSTLLGSARPVMYVLETSPQKQAMASQLAKQFGVQIDARTRLEVIADLAKQGIDAVPTLKSLDQLKYQTNNDENGSPGQMIALGGISGKATVLCNENGQHVIYDSDERGFHNPKGLWHAGAIDIAAVGDSFAQGFCVPSNANFVALIRQRHPATMNLGIAGDGPLLELATIREYVQPLHPRRVLWFYFEGNDLLDLQGERQSRLLMRYLAADFSQSLLQRQAEIDQAVRDLVEKEKTEAEEERRRRESRIEQGKAIVATLLDFVRLGALRSRLGFVAGTSTQELALSGELRAHMDLFRQALSRARTEVGAWGGTLYFVYLPNWTRYDNARTNAQEHRTAEKQRGEVLRIVRDLDIPIIDVVPTFDAKPDPMSLFPFRAPGHYTEEGHRLVANEVLRALDAQ